ncbi:sigma 54-interacting transcriptional regulator [Clostridium aminobutyricum]|uniref:Sigma 54-interacting transcriptional regulator n=1 Tax=Clostridium aminobutyricum TaxID=33953 RepID=A0A939IGC1_CLOAM|nr:sigma 54-interacting transcriptional regulator [Clostridium aminobutyricum]MBN7773065.1 sigma 54-interacting transcriptional regulator [Clostridium aminobutyricum]
MTEMKQALENIMDHLSKGLVYVDSNGRIQACNQKAKTITGIIFEQPATHESGQLKEGDIIIIADNKLGEDDGELDPADLSWLNIHDKNIKKGDMLIGIGVYKNSEIEPIYKYLREHQLRNPFKLDVNYLGFHISAMIDTANHEISISINGFEFTLPYFSSIGHMVAIDGSRGHIKFFQAKGYSVRKETIGNLLRGGSFMPKLPQSGGMDQLSVIGVQFLDLFEESDLSRKIFRILEGKEQPVQNVLYEINKRLVVCTIFPSVSSTDERETEGVYLLIEDASALEELLEDRNSLIEEIEKKHKQHLEHQKEFPEEVFQNFVGASSKTRETKYLAYKAAHTKFNVLITGESGTGKSKLAREIHDIKNPKAPFVEVNCNAIAPTLFESELFGYVGGAFTGASSSGKAGFFEAADGGTLFLDEIGDLPLEIQVKLLHVLQNKMIYRVGSSKPVQVDVRIIAATNKNLQEEVRKGGFRQDLFYRINVFPIEIPPLRERKGDLYLLINQIMRNVCAYYGMDIKQFSGEALRKMLSYHWPGNVRELENVIERAITLCETNLIYPEHISISQEVHPKTLKELVEREEARILENALFAFNGDKRVMMQELDISKTAFYEKIKKYGLKFSR